MNTDRPAAEYLFVYGTLRRAASPMHQLMARHSRYCGDGVLQGRLYEVGCYPGAVESAHPGDQVSGELYQILNPCLLDELDHYEACSAVFPPPHEYLRKSCWIRCQDDRRVLAWVYIFNHALDGLRRIESGDFMNNSAQLKQN